jgi:hypothetical protein
LLWSITAGERRGRSPLKAPSFENWDFLASSLGHSLLHWQTRPWASGQYRDEEQARTRILSALRDPSPLELSRHWHVISCLHFYIP